MSEQGDSKAPEQQPVPKSPAEKREERVRALMELNEHDLQAEAERVSEAFDEDDRETAEHLIPEDVIESREAIDKDVEEMLQKLNFAEDSPRKSQMAELIREQLAEEYAEHEYQSPESGTEEEVAKMRENAAAILTMPKEGFEDLVGRWTEYDDVQSAIAEIEHENELRAEAEALNQQFDRREKGLEVGDEMEVNGIKYEVTNIENDDEGNPKFATVRMTNLQNNRVRATRGTIDDIMAQLPPEMTGVNAPEGDPSQPPKNETADQTLNRLEQTLNAAEASTTTSSSAETSGDKSQYDQNIDFLRDLEQELSEENKELPDETQEKIKSLIEELAEILLRIKADQEAQNQQEGSETSSGDNSEPTNTNTAENQPGSETAAERPGGFKNWLERTKWAIKNPGAWLRGKTYDVLNRRTEQVDESVEGKRKLRRRIALGAAAVGTVVVAAWVFKDLSTTEVIAGNPTPVDAFSGGDAAGAAEAALKNPPLNEALNFYPDNITAKNGDSLWNIGRDMLQSAGVQNPDVTQLDAVEDSLVATNATYGPKNWINEGQQINTSAAKAVIQRFVNS